MTEEIYLSRYELMMIFDPNTGEEGSMKEVEKIKKNIQDLDGKVTSEDFWGLRDLAYRIKKERRGFYAVLNLEMDPAKTKEFEKDMSLEQSVLRFLLIKTPKYYEIKTFSELQKEAEELAKKKEQERKEKEEAKQSGSASRAPKFRKVEKQVSEKPVEKPIEKAPKVEKKVEKKTVDISKVDQKSETKEATKEAPKTKAKKDLLEDFDAKLKSIIDDPDLTL